MPYNPLQVKLDSQEREKTMCTPRPAFMHLLLPLVWIMLALCLMPVYSYHPGEVDLLAGGMDDPTYTKNLLGCLGTWTAWYFLLTFGIASYPLLLLGLLCSLRRLFCHRWLRPVSWEYYLSFPIFATGLAILFGIWPDFMRDFTEMLNISTLPGGVIGQRLTAPTGLLTLFMNWIGAAIVAAMLLCVSLGTIFFFDWYGNSPKKEAETSNAPQKQGKQTAPDKSAGEDKSLPQEKFQPQNNCKDKPEYRPTPITPRAKLSQEQPTPVPQHKFSKDGYEYPPLSLLNQNAESQTKANSSEIERNRNILQNTLANFHVEAEVKNAIAGPQVTLFHIAPAPGVLLNKFNSLENNIKMDLAAESLRILAPIPGENLVGIEVPNQERSLVTVYSLMQDSEWLNTKAHIPLLLGKNISGKSIILDLSRAPHLMIAGTTGSGKSVCMNLLITSLLFRFSPEELRLVMVDPKVVEFATYERLPHLVVPIINDPGKVLLALHWAINEMERRYSILAKVGVRDLIAFNDRPAQPANAEPVLDADGEPIPAKLPYIVVIIDELADIMLSANKAEVEKALARIAAKSRAVGIHTIIATQRPDTKVITGTIKSNFPVRIAFKVASYTDSMTILGGKGAESLLGYGDMLFVPPSSNIERIQCGMASDEERNKVVEFVSRQAEQHFDETVLVDHSENAGNDSAQDFGQDTGADGNALAYKAAECLLLQPNKAPSISFIQRRLGIGYNKAANVIEDLENCGIVSEPNSNGARRLLVESMAEAEKLLANQGEQS